MLMFSMLRLLFWIILKPAEILAIAMLGFDPSRLVNQREGRDGTDRGLLREVRGCMVFPPVGGAGGHMVYLG